MGSLPPDPQSAARAISSSIESAAAVACRCVTCSSAAPRSGSVGDAPTTRSFTDRTDLSGGGSGLGLGLKRSTQERSNTRGAFRATSVPLPYAARPFLRCDLAACVRRTVMVTADPSLRDTQRGMHATDMRDPRSRCAPAHAHAVHVRSSVARCAYGPFVKALA